MQGEIKPDFIITDAQLAHIREAFSQEGTAVNEALVAMMPAIRRMGQQIASGFAAGITEVMPAIRRMGQQIASGFAAGITEVMPAIRHFNYLARKRARARHIAHAAYGLTRKGSQGWRRG